jgi:hypothetical protein
MREALLGKLVLVLSRATSEELAAIYRFATGESLESAECGVRSAELKGGSAECGVRSAELKRGPADGSSEAGAERKSLYVFRWTGRDWKVVFGGGEPFYLEDTLGGRYLNYLVHHPNEPISAFELEVAVQPEKGEARSRNSIQPESDARALREYRQELRRLQAEKAQAVGQPEEVARLTSEIDALKSALKGVGAADTGERARINVRKAVVVVLGQLRKRGPEEKALAEHLRRHLSTGYECLYSLPEGRIWR